MSDQEIDLHEQAAKRAHRTLQDQHGRHYSANIETGPRSGHASGPVTPCMSPEWSVLAIMERERVNEEEAARISGQYDAWLKEHELWPHAPIIPPAKYLKPSRGDSQFLRIAYEEWKADELQGHEMWLQAVTDGARIYYKDQMAVVMEQIHAGADIREVSRPLFDLFGDRPMDVRIIDTCAAGKSRWILGLTNAQGEPMPRPEWADELLPRPVVYAAPAFADAELDSEGAFSDDDYSDALVGGDPPRNRGGRPRKVPQPA